jgi:hypothetical protein
MKTINIFNQRRLIVIGIVMSLFMSTAPSYAGIGDDQKLKETTAERRSSSNRGNVLSPKVEPKGYSLSDMAKLTAAFNVTDHSGAFPDVVNGHPFQGLFITSTNTFDVNEDTILYVPVILSDDSSPVVGNIPNVNNQHALERYFYSQKQYGAVYTNITIDGKVISLNHDYLVGVNVPALPDGGGTKYVTVAAFVSPLNKGKHTIGISAQATGNAFIPWCAIINSMVGFTYCTDGVQFSQEYTVNVH